MYRYWIIAGEDDPEGINDEKELLEYFNECVCDLGFIEKDDKALYDTIQNESHAELLKQSEALLAVMSAEKTDWIEFGKDMYLSSSNSLIEQQQEEEEEQEEGWQFSANFCDYDFSEHDFWISDYNGEEYIGIDDHVKFVRRITDGLDHIEINNPWLFKEILKMSIVIESRKAAQAGIDLLSSIIIENNEPSPCLVF